MKHAVHGGKLMFRPITQDIYYCQIPQLRQLLSNTSIETEKFLARVGIFRQLIILKQTARFI